MPSRPSQKMRKGELTGQAQEFAPIRARHPHGHRKEDRLGLVGRGERIRTAGLYVPNVALYQAKLHPEGLTVWRHWPALPERGRRIDQMERSDAKVANSSNLARLGEGGRSASDASAE